MVFPSVSVCRFENAPLFSLRSSKIYLVMDAIKACCSWGFHDFTGRLNMFLRWVIRKGPALSFSATMCLVGSTFGWDLL